jgi:ribonuclease J
LSERFFVIKIGGNCSCGEREMTKLSFYGGINEIGGNKILLEDEGKSLLLDFGYPYGTNKKYYEEYLKPRSGAGLLDHLKMGLIPPLQGLYRDDLALPGLWDEVKGMAGYRAVERPGGVLLSHAHLDHSGHISLLHPEIPVYATATTAFLVKAIQDTGVSTVEQQICYYSQYARNCLPGHREESIVSSRESKQQRQFCIADRSPESLDEAAQQFWSNGFWPKAKGINSCEMKDQNSCCLKVKCFPVDHSIMGACAWGIETAAGWIVYSGDLRLHGKHPELVREFIQQVKSLRPKALIIEGTRIENTTNSTEAEVYANALRVISGAKGFVIADFSARDIDRLLTFFNIARETGRKLVILPKDAYLLRTLRLLDPAIPDLMSDRDLLLYQKTSSAQGVWQRDLFEECGQKIVTAGDIHAEQGKFILSFSFFDLNELPSIDPQGGLYVFSTSEPHDEEQEIDMKRLHNWLEKFGMSAYGLPVEKDGQWQIPAEEKGLHASGHACGSDLVSLVKEVSPEILIPVHCTRPELYEEFLGGSGIKVTLPKLYSTIQI